MSERSLAHVEQIIDIQEIPGCDKIALATILGWKIIVQKEHFNIGDYCIFIETDSLLPKIEVFEFMSKRKFRVRTIKMKGVYSQGLAIPLKKGSNQESHEEFDDGTFWCFTDDVVKQCNIVPNRVLYIGDDVTKLLGIEKYESQTDKDSYEPTPKKKYNFFTRFMTRFNWYRRLFKIKSKSFPTFLNKTDEPRVQNIPWIIEKCKEIKLYKTEKLEGTNGNYWYINKLISPEFGICSRNVRKFELGNNYYSKIAKQLNIKQILKDYYKKNKINIAIQGEIIGPGINGNIYNLKELDFYIFNVFNIDKKEYLCYKDIVKFCCETGIKMVPILDENYIIEEDLQKLIDSSTGKSVLYDTLREGIVIRSYDQSISFKIVSPEYQLERGY